MNELTNSNLLEVGNNGLREHYYIGDNKLPADFIAKKRKLESLGISVPVSADAKQLNAMLNKANKKNEITVETVSSENEPENNQIISEKRVMGMSNITFIPFIIGVTVIGIGIYLSYRFISKKIVIKQQIKN